MPNLSFFLSSSVAALLFASSLSGAVLYRVEAMSGPNSNFFAVSPNGTVAGTNFGSGSGVRYQNGVLTDVGRNNSSFNSYALSVNDSGTLAGYQQASGQQAIYYNGIWNMISPVTGGTGGQFRDINSAGMMTGSGAGGALLFDGTTTVIDPNFRTGWSISESGVIVGERSGGQAVIRSAAGVVTNLPISGRPHGISANGRYVVATLFNNGATATLYDTQTGNASAIPGGGWNVDVRGVNSTGSAVGGAYFSSTNVFRAFVYNSVGGMLFLNDLVDPSLGLNLRNAYDINDAGQIVANGLNAQGQEVGYLLTPISDVPEPGTYALTGIALAAFAIYRRR